MTLTPQESVMPERVLCYDHKVDPEEVPTYWLKELCPDCLKAEVRRLLEREKALEKAAKDLDAAWDDFMAVDENDDNVGDMDGVINCVQKLRAALSALNPGEKK